jgi:hypothetical protein
MDYVMEIKENELKKIAALDRDSLAISNEIARLEKLRRDIHYEILKCKWLIGQGDTIIEPGCEGT